MYYDAFLIYAEVYDVWCVYSICQSHPISRQATVKCDTSH